MTVPDTVRRYLEEQQAAFDTRPHPAAITASETAEAAHVSGEILVKAVVLKDGSGLLVALLPATHVLHVSTLGEALGRELELASETDFETLFPDCDTGAVPAMSLPYGVETVVETTLLETPRLFLESGSHRDLVELSGDEFRRLYADSASHGFSTHRG